MDDESGLEARLQQLLTKRGQELVRGLIDEVTRLHREIVTLQRELGALSDYQAMRDRWLAIGDATARGAPLPRRLAVEPDQLLSARDGFYPVEYTDTGTAFRWTGPSRQFSFDLYVDRSHGAELELKVLNCIDFELQKDVGLLVDGVPVALELTQEGMGFDLRAALPAVHDGRSTNLVFVLPAVLAPPGSSDERLLGVAVGRLSLASAAAP